ncbi:MAG: peptidoglycan editing factor PgeF [Rickettsiaceae bacterium]|nr:peptidoglycan editing factor PgeF [Rickettsiaceae bacterium]
MTAYPWPKNIKYQIFDNSYKDSTHYYKPEATISEAEIVNNISSVCKDLNAKKILLLKQVHSPKIIIDDGRDSYANIEADGIITTASNIAIGVLTADCVPVLITNSKGDFIASLHCGWRGTAAGIIKEFSTILERNFPFIDNLYAIIGPAISQRRYEVSKELYNIFCNIDNSYDDLFLKTDSKDSFYFDLPSLVEIELRKIGITTLTSTIRKCSYDNPECFSWRRSRGLEKRRILSAIMIS